MDTQEKPEWTRTKPTGRYAIQRMGVDTTTNADDAMVLAERIGIKLSDIRFTPDVTLVHASMVTLDSTKRMLQIWSDDRVLRASLFPSRVDLPRLVSDAAAQLIAEAVDTAVGDHWRQGEWRELATITEIVGRTTLVEDGQTTWSGGWDVTLQCLDVRHTDGRTTSLYRGEAGWGVLGEDGDADTDYSVFRTEADGRAWIAAKRAVFA